MSKLGDYFHIPTDAEVKQLEQEAHQRELQRRQQYQTAMMQAQQTAVGLQNQAARNDVYQRVIADYERQLTEIKDKNMVMLKKVAHGAREDGVRRAADLVESMAEEMGNSNLLHAVVLALRNMDVPE